MVPIAFFKKLLHLFAVHLIFGLLLWMQSCGEGMHLCSFAHDRRVKCCEMPLPAKKLMATMKSPRSTEQESIKENDSKPKRARRKLYTMDISSPMEFSGQVVSGIVKKVFFKEAALGGQLI